MASPDFTPADGPSGPDRSPDQVALERDIYVAETQVQRLERDIEHRLARLEHRRDVHRRWCQRNTELIAEARALIRALNAQKQHVVELVETYGRRRQAGEK